jgi:IclR family acetate operon transcriptional repressor
MNASSAVVLESEPKGVSPDAGAALTAVDKAMVLLASVIASGGPLSLAELSRRTGLPKSTTHRLMTRLCAHKMVTRCAGRYHPGKYVVNTHAQVTRTLVSVLRSESTPYLVELHTTTGATASICVVTDAGPVCVNQVYGHRGIRLGSHAPAPAAIVKPLKPHGTGGPPSRPTAEEPSEIETADVAYSNEPLPGITSVAVALRDLTSESHWPAALAVSARTGNLEITTTARELRSSAHSLARAVRHHLAGRQAAVTRATSTGGPAAEHASSGQVRLKSSA